MKAQVTGECEDGKPSRLSCVADNCLGEHRLLPRVELFGIGHPHDQRNANG